MLINDTGEFLFTFYMCVTTIKDDFYHILVVLNCPMHFKYVCRMSQDIQAGEEYASQ